MYNAAKNNNLFNCVNNYDTDGEFFDPKIFGEDSDTGLSRNIEIVYFQDGKKEKSNRFYILYN